MRTAHVLALCSAGLLTGLLAGCVPTDNYYSGGNYPDRYPGGYVSDRLPPGSYRETCRDVYVERGVLYANCETANGQIVQSRLPIRDCREDVFNDDGRLRCGWGGGPRGGNRGSYQVPGGSYLQTCRDAYMNGSVLTATCEDDRGRLNRSSYDVGRCRGEIINDRGQLACYEGRYYR